MEVLVLVDLFGYIYLVYIREKWFLLDKKILSSELRKDGHKTIFPSSMSISASSVILAQNVGLRYVFFFKQGERSG